MRAIRRLGAAGGIEFVVRETDFENVLGNYPLERPLKYRTLHATLQRFASIAHMVRPLQYKRYYSLRLSLLEIVELIFEILQIEIAVRKDFKNLKFKISSRYSDFGTGLAFEKNNFVFRYVMF